MFRPRASQLLRRVLLCLLCVGTGLVPGVAWSHGLVHEQIAELDAALERQPDDVVSLVRRGELFRQHGLFSEARVDFDRVARLRPDDLTNHLCLGRLDVDARATNSALLHLKAWVQARPEHLEGRLLLAKACLLGCQPAEAAAELTQAIRLDTEPRPEWFHERAKAQVAAGQPAVTVLAGLDEGIRRYGPLPALQLLAVDVEMQRGATEAALGRLDALAARAERKERWLFRRGDLLLQAGRTNEARKEFLDARAALDALPDKLRRAWVATELRQQIDAKLAALPAAPETPGRKP